MITIEANVTREIFPGTSRIDTTVVVLVGILNKDTVRTSVAIMGRTLIVTTARILIAAKIGILIAIMIRTLIAILIATMIRALIAITAEASVKMRTGVQRGMLVRIMIGTLVGILVARVTAVLTVTLIGVNEVLVNGFLTRITIREGFAANQQVRTFIDMVPIREKVQKASNDPRTD